MKNFKKFCFISLIFVLVFSLWAQEKRDLLSGKFTTEILKEIIVSSKNWHPFPKAGEQDWRNVPEKVREAHIKQGEKNLNCDWETPKATVFLEYVRNGNRSNFQRISFERRRKLIELVLAESIEAKGRFTDDIVNGIWTICEETYWGVPAHVGMQKRGNGLPDVTEPTVDLFAAETGMMMAWIYYLVGDELEEISPLINERIRYEVHRRIIDVNLQRDDFWWMGFNRVVNNWNPWICSNWLTCVLILEDNEEKRIQSVYKILRCLDNFLNPYPEDGGCDEGPGYWSRAGASLFDCLELLHSASNGKIDIYNVPLIQEIGKYIYRAYIADNYYINFADAAARLNPEASLVFRYGKSINNKDMMGFGAHLAKRQNMGNNQIRGGFGGFGRILPTLFSLNELLSAEARVPMLRDFWLPELQVMGARSIEGSSEGLYLAAKGGHNAESHNHNDIGNFIVYADGYPAIIDIGVETYTAKTFSGRRYEIWTMQSAYHNLPTVNGVMQKDGREFKASEVKYSSDTKKAVFSLDIADSYPEEAKLKSWNRKITLNRGKNIIVRDKFELFEVIKNLELSLITWREPEIIEEGKIRLINPEGLKDSKGLFIKYDWEEFSADIEAIPLEDGRLRSSWGEKIYRIKLTMKKTSLKGDFSIRIE
ncbi:heparinase II/III family protein [candidate division KSB1 bacterium]